MKRFAPLLALILPACAGGPDRVAPSEIAGPPVPAEAPASPTGPATAALVQEPPLPPSILIDASLSRKGKEGGPPVTIHVRSGEPVPWTSTELALEPVPFEPSAVVAVPQFADHWAASRDEPGTVRIFSEVRGLPADALFLELVPADSVVIWADGSRGTFRDIHSQGRRPIDWSLDVLTTVPPESPEIRSLTLAVDLHRATRVRRHEASVGVGQAAAFEFGVCGRRWILPEDREVTEVQVARHGRPILPLHHRGLRTDRLVRLTDASGAILQETGSGGAGSVCFRDWGFSPERKPEPPLTITVDLPLETTTTRVLLRMQAIRPRK